jgi:hypothetical protein
MLLLTILNLFLAVDADVPNMKPYPPKLPGVPTVSRPQNTAKKEVTGLRAKSLIKCPINNRDYKLCGLLTTQDNLKTCFYARPATGWSLDGIEIYFAFNLPLCDAYAPVECVSSYVGYPAGLSPGVVTWMDVNGVFIPQGTLSPTAETSTDPETGLPALKFSLASAEEAVLTDGLFSMSVYLSCDHFAGPVSVIGVCDDFFCKGFTAYIRTNNPLFCASLQAS